jgi:hypothetical protein
LDETSLFAPPASTTAVPLLIFTTFADNPTHMWVIPPFFGKGRKERKQLGPAAVSESGVL